jgi:hypothetical protein
VADFWRDCEFCRRKDRIVSTEKIHECNWCGKPVRCKDLNAADENVYREKKQDWWKRIHLTVEDWQNQKAINQNLNNQLVELKRENQRLNQQLAESVASKGSSPPLAEVEKTVYLVHYVVQTVDYMVHEMLPKLQKNIEELAQKQEQSFNFLSERLNKLEDRIQALPAADFSGEAGITKLDSSNPLARVDETLEKQEADEVNPADSYGTALKWLDVYNQIAPDSDKETIAEFVRQEKAIEVLPTEDSLSNSWIARERPILFEEGTGTYWLIQVEGNCNAYLVPNKRKLRFNENNLKSIQVCFDLTQLGAAEDLPVDFSQFNLAYFTVESPAIMQQVEQSIQWELINRGVIKFTSKTSERP